MNISVNHYKLEVYAPEKHCREIMRAAAEAGAGRIGKYECCFSISLVTALWKPIEGAKPFSGIVGELSEASEVKIETRCTADYLNAVLKGVRAVHPYEEPLINVIPIEDTSASDQG